MAFVLVQIFHYLKITVSQLLEITVAVIYLSFLFLFVLFICIYIFIIWLIGQYAVRNLLYGPTSLKKMLISEL